MQSLLHAIAGAVEFTAGAIEFTIAVTEARDKVSYLSPTAAAVSHIATMLLCSQLHTMATVAVKPPL